MKEAISKLKRESVLAKGCGYGELDLRTCGRLLLATNDHDEAILILHTCFFHGRGFGGAMRMSEQFGSSFFFFVWSTIGQTKEKDLQRLSVI